MTNVIQPFHLLVIALAGWLIRLAHHLTIFNTGAVGVSSKSIVCFNVHSSQMPHMPSQLSSQKHVPTNAERQ